MKKYILSILACALITSCSFAQGTRIQPGGVPTPVPIFNISSQSNLIYFIASNLVQQLGQTLATNTITTSNINTIVVSNLNNFNTNVFSAFDDYPIQKYFSNFVFQKYVLDFGKTNSIGQPIEYAHLLNADSPPGIVFDVLTNLTDNRMLSFNVVGTSLKSIILNTNIFVWPRFDTNGWTHTATGWTHPLTNGNEFRMTIKTNDTGLSTTWRIYTQPF